MMLLHGGYLVLENNGWARTMGRRHNGHFIVAFVIQYLEKCASVTHILT